MLVDISTSMQTGNAPQDPSKFDYARRLTAALTYIGLVRLDTMLIQPFSHRLAEPFQCGGGRHRFQPAENFLRGLKPDGRTDFHEMARQYLSEYPQRGLTIVISDFLDDRDCFRPLQYVADFGHELFLVQLWGAEDREPTGAGELELIDVETNQRSIISFDDRARRAYTEAFDEHAAAVRKLALRNNGRYTGLSTETQLEEAIFGPLALAQAGV
jgi:uncharacterized protein (DUF58 family)